MNKRGQPEACQTSLEEARFWSRVDHRGPDECWPFVRGATTKDGYGVVRFRGGITTASRAAYRLAHGEIDAGMSVCHTCDNPPCCNPAHLWAGSPSENAQDMLLKGRRTLKLSDDDARAIFSDPRKGVELAREYGVSEAQISRIRLGHSRITARLSDLRANWGAPTGMLPHPENIDAPLTHPTRHTLSGVGGKEGRAESFIITGEP